METKRNKLITIFTSSFNRSDQIEILFDSLQAQTCKDFKWVVVDDGSESNKLKLAINKFSDSAEFEIIYIRRNNVGKYSELLSIFGMLDTDYFVCVDDDDTLSDNAIETMKIELCNLGENLGIIYPRNTNIGIVKKPIDVMDIWLYYKKHVETLVVIKSSILRDTAFPFFLNETFTSEEIIYNLLAEKGKFIYCDVVLCKSIYLKDGLTNNLFNHWRNNPKSTLALFESRYKFLSKYNFFKRKILRLKCLANYYSCTMMNKKMHTKIIGNICYFVISYPIGYLLYLIKRR